MGDPAETCVVSPCINICAMDERRSYCTGCYRTLGEIAQWSQCSAAQKLEVLERVKTRRAAAHERN